MSPTRMPTVSVIIPTFNHARWVLESVQSVLGQTFGDHEVIVVNDGSPDDTAAVLRPLAREGAIRYVEQSNRGQAAARNRGLAEARGEYVALLDDDDLWPPDKLQRQVALLESEPSAGAVGGSAVLIDGRGVEIGTSAVPDGWVTVESLLRGNPFLSPGQTLIRADVLRRAGRLNPRVWGADDYDLWFRLARHARIRTDSRPALFYRKHASNASRSGGRLLLHTESVIRSHLPCLPARRGVGIRREIYRNLYWWLGRAFVHELRRSLGRGDFAGAASAAISLAPLGRSILGDGFLWKQVLKDLLPDAAASRIAPWRRGRQAGCRECRE